MLIKAPAFQAPRDLRRMRHVQLQCRIRFFAIRQVLALCRRILLKILLVSRI